VHAVTRNLPDESQREHDVSNIVQRALAWSGSITIVGCLVGFVMAGFLPVPPGANLSAAQIAEFYSSNTSMIRIGLLLINIAMCFFAPMIALTTDQMLRINNAPRVLAHLQAIAGAAVVVFASAGPMFMNIAAFRPGRAPEITQALNDIGWILFIAPITVFLLQQFPIAVAVLMDSAEQPVFPRWVGYLNIWVPLSFLPAFLVYFAKSGPVAWQGVLVFYLGLATFGAWVIGMTYALVRATGRQDVGTRDSSSR
jgi:hypothetical protein